MALPLGVRASGALAGRTVEGGAARLDETADAAAAAGFRAGLAGPVVDAEAVLEVAEGAVDLRMVAQGRAARRHRLEEDLADREGETLGLHRRPAGAGGEAAGGGPGIEARAMQGLGDVDVAEAGDQTLIE